jgi:uncharacterized protein YcfJ
MPVQRSTQDISNMGELIMNNLKNIKLAIALVGGVSVFIFVTSVGVYSAPIVYPAKGQSEAQQSQDEGECHQWAVKTTAVDPARLAAETSSGEVYQRHHSALGGAARGAIGGLLVGAIAGDAGKGAEIGAGAGAISGSMQGRRDIEMQHQVAENAHAEQRAQLQLYDRAYGACLSGRGYTVD